jgi:hypothetical protein
MRIRLDTEDIYTFFAVIEHCDARHLIDKEMLLKHNEITCRECDEPIAFRGNNGLWYVAGGRIFP